MMGWILRSIVLLEILGVFEITRSTERALVCNQRGAVDHRNVELAELRRRSLRISVGELDAVELGEKIDAIGLVPELDHHVRIEKVLGAEAEVRKAEVVERSDDTARVLGGNLDPEGEVLGVPGLAVNSDGE